MKRLFLLLMPVMMLGLTACGNKLNAEKAKDVVLRGEQDRIPLIVQQLTIVDNITVDSMRITVDSEPMQGYLYTTWKNGKKLRLLFLSQISIQVRNTKAILNGNQTVRAQEKRIC